MIIKNTIILVLILSTSSLGVFSQDLHYYSIRSGMIKYKMEGRTIGNQIIYFDNFGKMISKTSNISVNSNGKTTIKSYIQIIKNDSIFELDLQSQTITIKHLTKESNQNLQNIISNEMIDIMGYKKVGNKDIAGVDCIEYSGENGKLWTWNNIVMKTEMNIMNIHITKEATEIIMGIDIPKSKFEIPKDYKKINQ